VPPLSLAPRELFLQQAALKQPAIPGHVEGRTSSSSLMLASTHAAKSMPCTCPVRRKPHHPRAIDRSNSNVPSAAVQRGAECVRSPIPSVDWTCSQLMGAGQCINRTAGAQHLHCAAGVAEVVVFRAQHRADQVPIAQVQHGVPPPHGCSGAVTIASAHDALHALLLLTRLPVANLRQRPACSICAKRHGLLHILQTVVESC
jgi:hypothetical protein